MLPDGFYDIIGRVERNVIELFLHAQDERRREEGGRVRNVYLGSCKKVSESEALEKARRLKAAAPGISTRM